MREWVSGHRSPRCVSVEVKLKERSWRRRKAGMLGLGVVHSCSELKQTCKLFRALSSRLPNSARVFLKWCRSIESLAKSHRLVQILSVLWESQQLALDYATATTHCYFAQNSVTAPNSWQKDLSLPVAVHLRGSWVCRRA